MRSSRVSLRPATTHVSVSGTPASTSAWRTCHPHAVATASASGPGQLGHPLAGLGQQVQHAELGQHDLVPVGPGADDAGQAADPVGQRAGAGVDEAGGEVVPRGVAGERRVGEARCAGGRRASGRARRARRAAARPARRGPARGRPASSARRPARLVRRATAPPPARSGAAAGAGRVPRDVAVDPRADAGRRRRRRHLAAHPHHQQGQGVLARVRAAGARAPPGDVGVVDHRVVRLAARAAAATPRRRARRRRATAQRDRDGEPLGGGEARRRGGDGHHLFDRPASPGRLYRGGVAAPRAGTAVSPTPVVVAPGRSADGPG